MIELIGTILAVVGVLANNRRFRWCFLLWMVSSLIFLAIDLHTGVISFVLRDAIFFLLAVEGWRKWK